MESPQVVFVFCGAGSRFGNAVFSSLELASAWIAQHKLTGLLTAYDLDDPAYDKLKQAGKLPRFRKGNVESQNIQRFCDGSRHWHFFPGLGEDDPGFAEAAEVWNAAQDQHRSS